MCQLVSKHGADFLYLQYLIRYVLNQKDSMRQNCLVQTKYLSAMFVLPKITRFKDRYPITQI